MFADSNVLKFLALFELDGVWLKPLEFTAYARVLDSTSSTSNNNHNSNNSSGKRATLALLVLMRRRAPSTAAVALSASASSTSARRKDSIYSMASSSGSTRSFGANATFISDSTTVAADESDELDQQLVREAVTSIDDQYVVLCDGGGNISAGSTIVDVLLDRHGSSSGQFGDSVFGGLQVFADFVNFF